MLETELSILVTVGELCWRTVGLKFWDCRLKAANLWSSSSCLWTATELRRGLEAMEAGVMVGARGIGVTMEVGEDRLESAPSVGGILSISQSLV